MTLTVSVIGEQLGVSWYHLSQKPTKNVQKLNFIKTNKNTELLWHLTMIYIYNDKFQISVNCILIQASTYILEGLSITNWQSFAAHAPPFSYNSNLATTVNILSELISCINTKLLLQLIRDLGTSDHTAPLYHYLISWGFHIDWDV